LAKKEERGNWVEKKKRGRNWAIGYVCGGYFFEAKQKKVGVCFDCIAILTRVSWTKENTMRRKVRFKIGTECIRGESR